MVSRGFGEKKEKEKYTDLLEIVKVGDPVLHEKVIDDMVKVIRGAPGIGLVAPQIGDVTIANGGLIPNIHKLLLPKKAAGSSKPSCR
ncbi:hypothetical protein L6452_01887 [Arctium lappa]|uniref:Uncharacterized protein n=1 Tax=Arctium lappa TaxID=4217 RepID=A0ACB9FHK7_ARCLA|nr:hypothetical protein L6452_01887 [Arctium lappa]